MNPDLNENAVRHGGYRQSADDANVSPARPAFFASAYTGERLNTGAIVNSAAVNTGNVMKITHETNERIFASENILPGTTTAFGDALLDNDMLNPYATRAEAKSTVVNTVNDIVNDNDNLCSLREAVVDYASPYGQVTFDNALNGSEILFGGTIQQTVRELTISGNGAQTIIAGDRHGANWVVEGSGGTSYIQILQDITFDSSVKMDINSRGSQWLQNGATVWSSYVNSGGVQRVDDGALALDTTIRDYGVVHYNGGKMIDVVQENGGAFTGTFTGGTNETWINGTNELGEFIFSGNVVSNFMLAHGFHAQLLLEGGISAYNTQVNYGQLSAYHTGTKLYDTNAVGSFIVMSSGAQAVDTAINGSYLIIGGGSLEETMVTAHYYTDENGEQRTSQGILQVEFGATANNTSVYTSGGRIRVYGVSETETGRITNTEAYHNATIVLHGGTAESTHLYGGSMWIQSYGSTGINDGDGGIAINTFVHSRGCLDIKNGVASNTTVHSAGVMTISSGGLIAGETILGGKMIVEVPNSDAQNSNITYNLTERTTGDTVIIDNIANLTNVGSYNVSIDSTQSGRYALAGHAADYSQSVSLTVSGALQSTVFTITGNTSNIIEVNGEQYQLSIIDDILYLNAKSSRLPEPPSLLVNIPGDIINVWDHDYSLREAVEVYATSLLDNGLATVKFHQVVDTLTIQLDDTLNFAENTYVLGNGTDKTIIAGTMIYGNGKEVSFEKLAFTAGNIVGGVYNANLAGDTSLTFKDATLKLANTAFVTAGSHVVNGMHEVKGSVNLSLDGVIAEGNFRIAAAGRAESGILLIRGDVNLNVTDSKGIFICGGGWARENGTVQINGNVNNTIVNAEVDYFYGGGYAQNGYSIIKGSVNTTVDQGTFKALLGNGTQLNANGSSTQGASSLTISGGTFNIVYAGAYSNGGIAVVNGGTTLNITAGTFNSHVFAGSFGESITTSRTYGDRTLINGSTNMTIDASAQITFKGNIYVGSGGNGVISGGTNLTISGLGENLRFGANSVISGNSQFATTLNNYITGERKLTFSNFKGDIDATLGGFSTITITGDSYVNYTAGAGRWQLEEVSLWDFTASRFNQIEGAVMRWTHGLNDFTGDTINLRLDSDIFGQGDTAVIVSAQEASVINGWDKAGAVNFYLGDSTTALTASWDDNRNGWLSSDDSYFFGNQPNSNTLIVTKIA